MSSKAAPSIEASRFQDAMRKIMSVPKAEIDKREDAWKNGQSDKKKKL